MTDFRFSHEFFVFVLFDLTSLPLHLRLCLDTNTFHPTLHHIFRSRRCSLVFSMCKHGHPTTNLLDCLSGLPCPYVLSPLRRHTHDLALFNPALLRHRDILAHTYATHFRFSPAFLLRSTSHHSRVVWWGGNTLYNSAWRSRTGDLSTMLSKVVKRIIISVY